MFTYVKVIYYCIIMYIHGVLETKVFPKMAGSKNKTVTKRKAVKVVEVDWNSVTQTPGNFPGVIAMNGVGKPGH